MALTNLIFILSAFVVSFDASAKVKTRLYSPQTLRSDLADTSALLLVENPDVKGKPSFVRLVEPNGKIRKEWNLHFGSVAADLTPEGHLVTIDFNENAYTNKRLLPKDKNRGLRIFDKQGKMIRFIRDDLSHHDFEILPNGNIAYLRWYEIENSFRSKIRGANMDQVSKEPIYADEIVEVDPDGKIVFQWKFTEAFSPKDFPLEDEEFLNELTHANSLRYLPEDPLSGQPAYLICFRTIHKMMIIRKSDKKILWISPDGVSFHQHDASLTKEGNILYFDNGKSFSRIVEINPKTNKTKLILNGGQRTHASLQFHLGFVGSVQKLENGNYFVIEGLRGYMAEFALPRKKVWQMFNVANEEIDNFWPYQAIFRVKRYSQDSLKKMKL